MTLRLRLYRSERQTVSLSLRSARLGLAAGIVATLIAMAGSARPLYAADESISSNPPVLATVGDHKITRQQVDDAVIDAIQQNQPNQLYDLRKQMLDSLINQYLIEQAAKKAGVPPQEYIKRQLADNAPATITEADAQKFYAAHKDQIKRPFDQIKAPLISFLQQQQNAHQREAVMEKLRASAPPVKVILAPPRVEVSSAGHPSIGGKDAAVTIVEFADFQCPYCRAAEPAIKEVEGKYGDKVRLVYMDFPLSFHAHALDAAKAARCAGEQDKFWQYHDALFSDQAKLDPASLKATAKQIGLNTAKFDSCFDKGKYDAAIRKDQAEGSSLGVTGTPTFFVNGRELEGAQQPQAFATVIDEELANTGNASQANAK